MVKSDENFKWVVFGMSIALLFAIVFTLQPQAEAIMSVPAGQQVISYDPIVTPLLNDDQTLARPVGVGSVATGGTTLSLKVGFPQFSSPVDIYLALYAPAIDPNIWMITSGLGLQPVSAGLVKWRESTVGPIDEALYGDITLAFLALPLGTYNVYAAVTPAMSLSVYYLWQTHFVIAGVYATTGTWDISKWDTDKWGP